ncbi:MAG: efflux RND transporter periplasmic adaptor subunit [Saprospiraceae bacterium]|nr:efflux RND transporter periplasmic adaptor subunit [Saprospiraceae bacterium]
MRYPIFLISLLTLLSACKQDNTALVDPDVYYTCSMDPQVVAYVPGSCPICKMPLTLMRKGKGMKAGEIQLTDQQIQLGNIAYDTVRSGAIGEETAFTATLAADLTKTYTLSARMAGRLDRLYVKSEGDKVTKGQRIYDLNSEELQAAKEEYVLVLQKQKTQQGALVDYSELARQARQKLLLWGLSDNQLDELAKSGRVGDHSSFFSPYSGYVLEVSQEEGAYVMDGSPIIRLADLSGLWVEAQVHVSQLGSLRPGQSVAVRLPDFPELTLRGRVDFVNPELSAGSRLNLVRVAIPNPGMQLRPGLPATIVVPGQAQQALTLPLSAVLRSGGGAQVWLYEGDNTFRSVAVETGLETAERVAISAGLQAGDVVVTSGAYLLQSEYVIKRGAAPE